MATTQEYALLSLYVYQVENSAVNRPNLPTGWTLLDAKNDNLFGFSYGVFQRSGTGEIVLSYTGTNGNIDWASNFTAGTGLPSWQVANAALVYQRVKETYGSNITLSGHSLGGGLASVMATWFNRPAVVFDEAPFQTTAANPIMLALVRAQMFLGGYTDPAMDNAIIDFSTREAQVANHYLQGEILNALRFEQNTVAGSNTQIDINGNQASSVTLHSLALLTAARMNEGFRLATYASGNVVPLIMDENLYAFNTGSSTQKNFLLDLIRSEQTTPNDSKLDNFAEDLQKLGTNLAGLSAKAQDALIAQGIEWYYWQTTNYAGQNFFIDNGQAGLLQYTSAVGAALPGALNKATTYTQKWLGEVYVAHGGAAGFPPFGTLFDQWSVATSSTAVTVTARDANKTQIYIGQGGGDTFTAGNAGDVILAGGGNDTLNGGAGYDLLYGGAGQDTYNFTGAFGGDKILDSDGTGEIKVDGAAALTGGKKLSASLDIWESDNGLYRYTQMSGNLIITKGSKAGVDDMKGSITVQGWTAGQLGITLGTEVVTAAQVDYTYKGDQRPPIYYQYPGAEAQYNWGDVSWALDGSLIGGVQEADFADVVYGSGNHKDKINGLGGNDALAGLGGDDEIDGGSGDDLIVGGGGIDRLKGGAGNDWIFGARDMMVTFRYSPDNVWPPSGAPLPPTYTVLAQGKTWGIYRSFFDNTFNTFIDHLTVGNSDLAPDILDGGDGDDNVIGGGGADYIEGGLGSDKLYGSWASDIIYGGHGDDYAWGDAELSAYSGYIINYSNTPAALHGDDFIDGGDGNDQLIGQGGNDELYGGAGSDQLIGDDINETYLGGAFHGNDYLDGEDGNDTLRGGGKNDDLYGGAGDDQLFGDDINESYLAGNFHGNDYLDGEDGNDLLLGGGKDDDLFGGAGDDNLMGDAGRIELAGAFHGNDFMDGEDGADTMSGGGKDDTMLGGLGNDTMFGDAGINPQFNIEGEFHGNDYLDGEGGDDFMFGDGKDDILIGGAGADILYGDNLTQYVAGGFHGNDDLDGGDGNDTLYGGGKDDILTGGAGDDQLQGDDVQSDLAGQFHGNDQLDGGDGNDRLFGQGGNDDLSGGAGNDMLVGDGKVSDIAGQYHGNDHLSGGDGDDVLTGGGGMDTLYGGAGNDTLQGDGLVAEVPLQWHNDDYLDGGDGFDVLFGGGGADTLLGGAGSDFLYGDDGNDSLYGGADNDYMFGRDGNDFLDGGDGNDRLEGQAGTNTLFGGAGNDFLISTGDNDTVDGGEGADKIFAEGSGNTTVLVGRGSGQDAFFWNSGAGGTTKLQFKDGITAADLVTYRRQFAGGSASLAIGIAGTTDLIELGPYPFDDAPVGGTFNLIDIRLADGSVYTPTLNGIGQYVASASSTQGNPTVLGSELADILYVSSNKPTTIFAGAGNDVLLGISEDLTFGEQAHQYYGEDGNDYLLGGHGNEILNGGAGDDTLDGNSGGFYGVYGISDGLTGGDGSNTYIFGKSYLNDYVDASRSSGAGDIQTLSLKDINPGDVVLTRKTNEVVDSLFISVTGTTDSLEIYQYFMPDSIGPTDYSIDQIKFADGTVWTQADIVSHLTIADQVITGQETIYDILQGGSGNDTLYGLGQGDILKGGAGNDTMIGGTGDDKYYVRDAGDQTIELANEGMDRVNAYLSWTLAANIEDLILEDPVVSSIDTNGTGNELNNSITGNAGNNVLDGGLGADTMLGGLGNDSYYIDDVGDVITENLDEGVDTVYSSITKTLGANFENLTLIGAANINGSGNSLDNLLSGNAGNNALNGGAGADTLAGGAGNDTYTVDNVGDVVVELTGEGTDSVSSSVSYALSAEVENLTLTGTAALNGTGNASDNLLTGNSGANVLTGGAGNDTYIVGTGDTTIEVAGGGIDTVQSSIAWSLAVEIENLTLTGSSAVAGTGNASANILTGNTGVNVLTGGAGNDTYIVGTGDTTIEVAVGGIDSVQSGVTWTLAAEVENLTLTGATVINGTGNASANVLTGNSAANTLTGLAGDDTYLFGVGGGADRVVDSAGNDRIVFGAGITSGQITATRVGSVVKLIVNGTDSISIDDLGGGLFAVEQFEFADASVLGAAWLNSILPSAAPTATNLSAAEAYTEDTARNLVDMVVADADSTNTTVTLTLSNLAAGSFNAGTSGTVTSTFNAGTGVWTASGAIASVNTLLAALTFTPTANFNGNFTLATSVSDGVNPAVTGSKAFTGTKVNDASTGTVTISGIAAQGQTLTATNTVADVDGLGVIAYQWKAAGVNIAGATASSFVLTSTQVGRAITVSASFTDGGGTAESKTSAATASVIASVTGTSAANTLNGSTGAELMIGLAGNDTYLVNNAGDLVLENLNEGTDLVNASVSHTLGANVENITLTGSSAINATGNALDNVLTGNSGANVLTGGAGNDTYVAGAGDTIVEALNGGTDTVQIGITHTLAANVENLTLTGTSAINGTGNTDANVLAGNSGVNTLTGNAGNDTLDGKAGADSLVGGAGNDTYWLGRGYGIDAITETDATAGNTDIARFESGVATDQLWFRQVSNNLEVTIIGTSDRFNIVNWYTGNANHVEQFKTSDGKTLLDSQVQNLVSAMAAFAPPAAGQTTLPANYATALAPVIAANWV